LWTLRTHGHNRQVAETGHQTELLEEYVQGHDTVMPVIAQKLLAVSVATAVNTPKPPAPNHTQRPKITRAEPASSTRMAAAARRNVGHRYLRCCARVSRPPGCDP